MSILKNESISLIDTRKTEIEIFGYLETLAVISLSLTIWFSQKNELDIAMRMLVHRSSDVCAMRMQQNVASFWNILPAHVQPTQVYLNCKQAADTYFQKSKQTADFPKKYKQTAVISNVHKCKLDIGPPRAFVFH